MTTLPPELVAFSDLLDAQPAPVRDVFQYCLCVLMAQAGVMRIENSGGSTADMIRWTLRDEANHVFTFPAFSLEPGASVQVWVKAGANDAGNLYWGAGSAIWNNTGDCAYLRDGGEAGVSTYCY
jgi:hypothetical protein